MANQSRKRKTKSTKEDDAVSEAVEEVESTSRPSRAPQPRLSITITAPLRKAIRIAAARADLEPGEWSKAVLAAAAQKTVEKLYGDES